MSKLNEAAPAFVEMAHAIVWADVTTVDAKGRPRARVLHPYWEWDGERLTGWVGTTPTPFKRAHLDHSPYASVNYWTPTHDTCLAECRAEFVYDDERRTWLWEAYKAAPPPLGYDPAMIPTWKGPTHESFAALRFDPYHVRVFPGTLLLEQRGTFLEWRE